MDWKDWLRWYLGIGIPIEEHGIVNFHIAIPNKLYGCGQPVTKESWEYIKSLGVEFVFKLNFESEGSDTLATELGLKVRDCSMPPDDLLQSLQKPNLNLIYSTVDLLYSALQQSEKGCLCHCSHGQDRTNLIICILLVKYYNWTCETAYKYMLKHGFHWELVDLQECWNEFCESRRNLDPK